MRRPSPRSCAGTSARSRQPCRARRLASAPARSLPRIVQTQLDQTSFPAGTEPSPQRAQSGQGVWLRDLGSELCALRENEFLPQGVIDAHFGHVRYRTRRFRPVVRPPRRPAATAAPAHLFLRRRPPTRGDCADLRRAHRRLAGAPRENRRLLVGRDGRPGALPRRDAAEAWAPRAGGTPFSGLARALVAPLSRPPPRRRGRRTDRRGRNHRPAPAPDRGVGRRRGAARSP
jgi:hypothetical protein